MRFFFFNFLLIFFLACNEKADIEVPQDEIMASTAGQSFSDKVRIPISAYGPIDTSNMPKIEFDNPEYNFDTIQSGEKIEHQFSFKNVGTSDLKIIETKVSCGCTIASYSKESIKPDSSGTLSVLFNSENKKAYQEKNIIVITNSYPNESTITMKGFVR